MSGWKKGWRRKNGSAPGRPMGNLDKISNALINSGKLHGDECYLIFISNFERFWFGCHVVESVDSTLTAHAGSLTTMLAIHGGDWCGSMAIPAGKRYELNDGQNGNVAERTAPRGRTNHGP